MSAPDSDDLLRRLELELGEAGDAMEARTVKTRYLGPDGEITRLSRRDFRTMSPDERKKFGIAFNGLKTSAEKLCKNALERLSRQDERRLSTDPTLPPRTSNLGAIHPIASTQAEVEDIFRSMGFQVFTGDEAVDPYENFDALNIPADHPARDMQDTFWLENGMVLRTHTSSMQNRAMRSLGVPLRAIFPGRCYRNEATDLTHEDTFYQLEGLMVAPDLSVAHLISVMRDLLSAVFEREIEVRLRPGFFPFVEPGFELDFRTEIKGVDRWVELMPCGMVHPAVLRNADVDADRYNGFAFGLGLTRLAMLKHGIPDVRLFNSGDLRFCRQFRATL